MEEAKDLFNKESKLVSKEHHRENMKAAGGQLTFGAFTGLISGYAVRQGGKILAIVLGTGFIAAQSLSYLGYINVDWRKFERDYHHVFDRDGDGKVTMDDVKMVMKDTNEFLKFNLPSGAGFTAGFSYGLTRSVRATLFTPLAFAAGTSYLMGGVPTDLFGEKSAFGTSTATGWLKNNKFWKKKSLYEEFKEYLETKDYYELRALKTANEIGKLKEVDPAFSILEYNEKIHKEIVDDLIDNLSAEKAPKNPILRWMY